MEGIKISLDTTGAGNDINLVRVDGVIDTMTATELERVLDSLLKQNKFNIIVDLAGVDYISSAGWGIFISNIREIRANAGDIKLARMIASVYEIFELLEFDSILHAYDNIEKARNNFQLGGWDGHRKRTSELTADTEVLQTEQPVEVKTEEYQPTEEPPQPEVDTTAAAAPQPAIAERVLALVKADPFYTIREIVRLVNEGSDNAGEPAGWWKVWNILRRNSLLSKRRRCRYSRR
ncbi:MAG: STAS domain-containing protein [candidate division Zixibacteria bacterium]|nr:STAS domain-containing protein [candidate division Zixibacteria bacterium]